MGLELSLLQVLFTIGSVGYQLAQAKKQKEAAEKAKGFEFTVSGEASPIPVLYGKNTVGGIAVKHHVSGFYQSASTAGSTLFAYGLDNTTVVPEIRTTEGGGDPPRILEFVEENKNELLHVQYVIAQDGIEGVQHVKVNDMDYNDADQKFKHSIRTYADGGVEDLVATANGIPATNTFTGTAYASATFKLNRGNPQYNGPPAMSFLTKGRKVRAVNLSAGAYSLSTSYVYSSNPALCLLDYMLNADFGRGITVSELDLKSFYDASVVCGTIVSTGRAIAGEINGGVGTRDIPLYECNITLDPNDTVRDNIESIMATMALAELTWSSEGKYKLLVEYPTSEAELDALVNASHYFTDDDIVRDSVDLSWPSASERFNQYTVTFKNEHEDFKSDAVTWPTSLSTAHTTYLTEDSNQPFVGSSSLEGITDPYHATATAEQIVRQSRSAITLSLTVTKKGLSLEPGDFINITSATSSISDEVYRVQSIEVMSDFTVRLTCYFFDYTALAWNVDDDIAYSTRPVYDFEIDPVELLTYEAGSVSYDHPALGELLWVSPVSGTFKSIVSYTNGSGDLVKLGETITDKFLIHPKDEWTDGQSVTFSVQSETPLGKLSDAASVTVAVVKSPPAPTSLSVVEDLYQTNKASGVKAKATISFATLSGGVEAKDYRVEFYRDEDGSTYQLLGYTVGQSFVFNDIRAGNYHFRITPISWFDDEGTALVGTKVILGLSAIPSDPTGFTGMATDTGILLTWDTPADLDVVAGGRTEIRYVKDDVVSPSWAIAQVVANNISGSTTTATMPLIAGYYLIKHFDSSGNVSSGYSQFLNAFVGTDYNAVTTITEDPQFAGTKTNCTIYPIEMVTNGTFDTDASGWTERNSPTVTVTAGVVRVAYLATNFAHISQTVSGLVIGRDYLVTAELLGTGGNNGRVDLDHDGANGSGNVINQTAVATSGSYTFTATATTAYIQLYSLGTSGYADYDDVSVKEVVDPTLELNASVTTMEYAFDNTIDLGSVENVRIVPSVTAVISDATLTVADYTLISEVSRFSGPILDAVVAFEVRHTDDDPAGSPTWSDWESFTVGNYKHRAFEFRLGAVVASDDYSVSISALSLTVDKADVTKRGTSSTAGGNTTVTFDTPFYGGIGGTDLPYIGVSTVGATSGSGVDIVSISATGFVYSVSGGGAGTKNVVWQAVGQ